MMWYWGGGWHWWDWLVGVVVMVAFWAVIVWALWIVARGLLGPRESDRHEADRLARGEIGLEEYQSLRRVLQGDRRSHEEEEGHRAGEKEWVGR
jgi:flagellar biosynthesis/type III secretory pathway M-ring protein FliF/YscJ